MLVRKYKNLTVEYDNHEDLLNEKFDNVIKRIDPVLRNIEKRIRNKTFTENYYTSVRVAPGSFVIIYVEPNSKAGLFLFASNGEKISCNIKGKDFELLDNNYIMYDFEDKCRNIDRNNYKDQNIVKSKLDAILSGKYENIIHNHNGYEINKDNEFNR